MICDFVGKLTITQKLSRYNMYGDLEERVHEVGEERVFPHSRWLLDDGIAYFMNTSMVEPDSWKLSTSRRLVKGVARDCVVIQASGTFDWEGVPTDSDTHLLYSYNVRVYPPVDVPVLGVLTTIEERVRMFVSDVMADDGEGM